MFIVDAHLDLAMNAMEWNRDLFIPHYSRVFVMKSQNTNLAGRPVELESTEVF